MTLSDNYMLDVIDVNVKIEDAQILQDVTFSTTSGNILAILGPTGKYGYITCDFSSLSKVT